MIGKHESSSTKSHPMYLKLKQKKGYLVALNVYGFLPKQSLSLRIHWCNEKTHQVRDSILNDLSPFYFSLEFWNNCYGGRLLDKGRLLERASNTNIVAIEAFFKQETFFWEGGGGGGGGQLYNLRYVKISYINVPHHCCTWQLLKMYVLPKIVQKLQITYSRATSIKHLFITDNFRTKFSQFFPWKDKKDSIYKRTKDQEGGDYQKSQDSNRLERSSWKWNLLFGRVFTKHPMEAPRVSTYTFSSRFRFLLDVTRAFSAHAVDLWQV